MKANDMKYPDKFRFEIAEIISKFDPNLHIIDLSMLRNNYKRLVADDLASLIIRLSKNDFITANEICKAIIKSNMQACY